MTEDVASKLKDMFKFDYTVEEACDYAEISTKAYYRRFKADEVFRGEMEKAQRALFRASKRAIAAEIYGKKKNVRLALDILKHRQPERYRTKIETDVLPIGNITVILPGSKPHPRIIPVDPNAEEDED